MPSWPTVPLALLADIRVSNVDKKSKPGEKPVRLCNYMDVYSNDYITADLPFMESTASASELAKFGVCKGDVFITKDSETPYDIGIPSVADEEVEGLVCGYHLALIRTRDKGAVDSTYLSKQLASAEVAAYYARMAGGSTRYGLSTRAIEHTPIKLPPIGTQQVVARVLRQADQAIEKTEALIEKYQQIKAGLMHDLFTRGIGADGKLRPPREQAPELYQETPIGWIPKDWQVSKMADLAMPFKGSTVIGPFGSDLVMSDYRSEGVPVVFVRDVKEDGFSWVSNVFISSHKAQKLFAHRVNAGDLLVTKMGLPPCVCAVYSSDMPMGIITADMIRMSPDLSKVDANWLCASINHDRVKRQVAGITAGVTRPKVTLADFRSLKVALPTLQEQQAVWSILGAIVKRLASETGQLEKLRLEKEGLMTDLLSGRVEVTNV